VHHYHAYLQGAWASLIGFAISVVPRRWSLPTRRAAWAALGIAGVAGGVGFITQPWDLSKRAAALAEPDAILDRHAYSWILEHTGPDALFATPLPDMDARPSNIGPQAAAVIAAGRRLVAAPVRHANPFLDWNDRNARRVRYLNSLTDVTGETQALCAFEHEAGPRGNAFFLVPNALIVRAQAVSLVFRDRVDTIYRVIAGPCVSER